MKKVKAGRKSKPDHLTEWCLLYLGTVTLLLDEDKFYFYQNCVYYSLKPMKYFPFLTQ